MRKMGIPDGAIRHKMKQDGMEAADIASFFSTPAAELKVLTNTDSVSTEAASSNSSKVGLEKYSKMKKLGLPDGAIRQKMQRDGVSNTDIAAFFGERPPAAAGLQTKSDLKNREDMKKYFKMKWIPKASHTICLHVILS